MTSVIEPLLPYKLNSDFFESNNTVVHRRSSTDPRSVVLAAETWHTEERGAFGVVWRQREKTSGQLRAVKIVSKLQFNPRELEAMVELQDRPDLSVSFFGWYEDPHAMHIAMEYIAHGDLGQYIKNNRGTAMSNVKEITTQILRGLVILHEKGIRHRDLKSQNILIASTSPMHVKLTDFGISKRAVQTSLPTDCGTTSYRAPEQLGLLPKHMKSGRSYTNAVDLWALGVLVHEILTSEVVFLEQAGESNISTSTIDNVPGIDMDLLYRYCRDPELFPVSALQLNGVNPDWVGFVKRLMAVDPRIRLTAADALGMISAIQTDARLLSRRLTFLPLEVQNEILNRFLACAGDLLVAKLAGLVGQRDRDVRNTSPIYANFPTASVIPQKLDDAEQYRALLRMATSQTAIQLMSDHGVIISTQSRGFKNQDCLKPLQAAAARGRLRAMSLLILHGIVDVMGLRVTHISEANAQAGTADSQTLRPKDKERDPIQTAVDDMVGMDIGSLDICRSALWADFNVWGRTGAHAADVNILRG